MYMNCQLIEIVKSNLKIGKFLQEECKEYLKIIRLKMQIEFYRYALLINRNKKIIYGNIRYIRDIMIQHKLLVIDDDKDLCKLIKKLLEREGFSVTLRYDGVSGLNETYVSDYKLIILDIMLPNKNGFDVLADIRKNNNVPVLMLTAKDSEGDKVSGLRMVNTITLIFKKFTNYVCD